MSRYPHNNLNREQCAALDRLRAPRFEFRRYWQSVTLTDPDGKGLHFFYRQRRTWTFLVKGWPVIVVSGRVQEHREPLLPLWPPPEPALRGKIAALCRLRERSRG